MYRSYKNMPPTQMLSYAHVRTVSKLYHKSKVKRIDPFLAFFILQFIVGRYVLNEKE